MELSTATTLSIVHFAPDVLFTSEGSRTIEFAGVAEELWYIRYSKRSIYEEVEDN